MKNALLLSFLFCTNLSFSQGEFNHWHFGDQAGINFNTTPPSPIVNSAMSTFESCSSISDATGNLIFYTNGGPYNSHPYPGGVWNSSNQLMPNGDLSNSNTSCNSSLQGTVIVPDPGNNQEYYIFTVDCGENTNSSGLGGLRYHKVNMSLDNGLGDVIQKDIPVITNTSLVEGLICIKHSNQQDYWIIVAESNTNNYFVTLVDSNGPQSAVISTLGPILDFQATGFSTNSCGSLIASGGLLSQAQLMDFDNSSGILSNSQGLGITGVPGSAFSPNDQYIYLHEINNGNFYQLDVTAPNIVSSATLIGNDPYASGQMRLAPDGKIYYPRFTRPDLGAIVSPNQLGVNADLDSTHFPSPGSTFTMPNFYYKTNCEPSSISYSNLEELVISPNPFKNQVTLESGSNDPIEKVTVYKLSGSIIWSNTYSNATKINLNLNLESGSYIIETIRSSGSSKKSKIVKL